MFSWLTGPRITNVIEDLGTQPQNDTPCVCEADDKDPGYDTTFVEPPDTPAPQFAVKAFRQALFGTPAPPQRSPVKKLDQKPKTEAPNASAPVFSVPKEDVPPASPSKLPNGVLRTPGTASKGRKTVSFGAHVVDNDGKKGAVGKSGIPNDCPGKFPSPWTPGTALKVEVASDTKPRTKLTEALYNARSTDQPKSGQKPKAKDDNDITLDLDNPRSESGRYWKEQYETYAQRSQKEMKKLVTKQQLAKNYAKKKDSEAIEAATRLAEERKRFRSRERQLEEQNKDYQERLRQAMAENTAASIEITALKNRIAALENSLAVPSSDEQNSKISFQIYEDSNNDSSHLLLEQEKVSDARSRPAVQPPSEILAKPVESSSMLAENKENSPPKLSHVRRQTLQEVSARRATDYSVMSNHVAEATYVTSVGGKLKLAQQHADQPPKSSLSVRKLEPSKENLPPKSPMVLPSSPLPQPSPDPWMDFNNDSPAPAIDRLAFPISSGLGSGSGYSRASKPAVPRHRVSRSVVPATKAGIHKAETNTTKSEVKGASGKTHAASRLEPKETKTEIAKVAEVVVERAVLAELKPDFPKPTSNLAEGSTLLGKNKNPLPLDRKEEARRRLQERKQRKQKQMGTS
jgi:hypothetical protein